MPGSPESDESKSQSRPSERSGRPAGVRAPLHPGASLLGFAALLAALSATGSVPALGLAAAAAFAGALRAERRAIRAELPLLLLALVVFSAHLVFSGRPLRESLLPAGRIALRLLALVYLMRCAARAALPRIARWLFGRGGPARPRPLALLFESARMTVALLPLALSEAERQHRALRARALRPGRGLAGRARYLAAWLLPYLGTMLRVGDAYGEALHARGYALGARRRASSRWVWGMRETAWSAGCLAAAFWILRAA